MPNNLEVVRRDNETMDSFLKRYTRLMRKTGLMGKIRSLERYEKPSVRRRNKKRLGIHRSQNQKSE